MEKYKYQLLIFDCDGTIADTDETIFHGLYALYDRFSDGKRPPLSHLITFSGPPILDSLEKEFPTHDKYMLYKIYHEASIPLYEKLIKSYPYEQEVLLELKKEGIKFALVTNKRHDLALKVLKIIKLDELFDLIIGSNDVNKLKPNSEGIIKALNYFSLPKEKALYIGDNYIDLETANNAQIDSMIVTWGPRVWKSEESPTYFIKSYLELKEVIKN